MPAELTTFCWSTNISKKFPCSCWKEYAAGGREFLHSIMIGDKSWFRHFNPGTKEQKHGMVSCNVAQEKEVKIMPCICLTM